MLNIIICTASLVIGSWGFLSMYLRNKRDKEVLLLATTVGSNEIRDSVQKMGESLIEHPEYWKYTDATHTFLRFKKSKLYLEVYPAIKGIKIIGFNSIDELNSYETEYIWNQLTFFESQSIIQSLNRNKHNAYMKELKLTSADIYKNAQQLGRELVFKDGALVKEL